MSLIPFIISFLTVIFFVPIIIRFGKKFNFLDLPDSRKVNKIPTVRLGGVAIYIGIILGIFFQLISGINMHQQYDLVLVRSFLITTSLIFFIGLIDDIYNISPLFRLFSQIVISSSIWKFGVKISSLDLSFLGFNESIELSTTLSWCISVLWITGLINAINWLDGIDGLAVGIAFISACGISIISYLLGNLFVSGLGIILAGATLAFLIFNIRPHKIIMGDCGSNLLGYILALLSILGLSSSKDVNLNQIEFRILTSGLIFLIPIFDMAKTIAVRLINQSSPFLPDKNHLHHFLLSKGFSIIQTTTIICSFSLVSNSIAILTIM
tara:strand:- start:136 stop:1107 length:972 start_codon:yes stop_codon:yes gene_type:complete